MTARAAPAFPDEEMNMSLTSQVREIEKLKCSALREKFRELTGVETKSNNKPYLIKRIAAELFKREHAPKASAEAPKVDGAPARASKPESNAKPAPTGKAAAGKATSGRSRKQRD